MNLLLDTHIFLWFVFAETALNSYARSLIEDKANTKFLSMASVWEMAIKHSIGKLPLTLPFEEFMRQQPERNNLVLLPMEFDHLIKVSSLPMHHRDPFDRLMIAQAMTENMAVVSADAAFDAYGVTRLWWRSRNRDFCCLCVKFSPVS